MTKIICAVMAIVHIAKAVTQLALDFWIWMRIPYSYRTSLKTRLWKFAVRILAVGEVGSQSTSLEFLVVQ